MAAVHDLKYTPQHEWLLVEGDTVTVGITQFAADALGDVVYIDLPQVGTPVSAGTVVGEIESTKSVGELFAPVDGTITAANHAVVDSPDLVNTDPFGEGWLVTVAVAQLPEDLLSYDEYVALTGE